MFPGRLNRTQKRRIEYECTRDLVECEVRGYTNLPLKGSIAISLSVSGSHLLATSRSYFSLIDVHSQLYKKNLSPDGQGSKSCRCNFSAKNSGQQIFSKLLSYKTGCTSSLWYTVDDKIGLTAGDCVVDVWDTTKPEISYTFTNLSSRVSILAVAGGSNASPLVAAGQACGTVSICDMRSGCTNNCFKPKTSHSVTSLKFLPLSQNHIISGYLNGSMLIWDLRRYNIPLYSVKRGFGAGEIGGRSERFILGASINSGSGTLCRNQKQLKRILSHDFKDENDLWAYIKNHSTSNNQTGQNINRETITKRTIQRGSVNPRKRAANNLTRSTSNSENGRLHITDIQFTRDMCTFYAINPLGIIEAYDSRSFKRIGQINFALNSRFDKNLQNIKMQLIGNDTFLAFNYRDSVVLLDPKKEKSHRIIPLTLGSETISSSHSNDVVSEVGEDIYCLTPNIQPSSSHITDLTTAGPVRDLYAVNEAGDLYVIHPNYKRIYDRSEHV